MGQQASSAQDKFPYRPVREVQSSPRTNGDFRWSLWDGQDVKDTSKQVSIFCLEPSSHPLSQAIFKRFKTLRHPGILPFINGTTVEEERRTYIVTDRIEPLETKLADILACPDAIPWGIYQITVRNLSNTILYTIFYHVRSVYFLKGSIKTRKSDKTFADLFNVCFTRSYRKQCTG